MPTKNEPVNKVLSLVKGHTTRIVFPNVEHDEYVVLCQDCDFMSRAKSVEEARFDVRYHALKMSRTLEPDWDSLL